MWDVATGEEMSRIPTSSDGPKAIFTQDEQQIIAPTSEKDPRMAHWDIVTGERRRTMGGAGPIAHVGGSLVMARPTGDTLTFAPVPVGREMWRTPTPPVVLSRGLIEWWVRFSDTGALVAINEGGEGDPVNFTFYLAHRGQRVGSIPGHADFRLVDDDRHMFLGADDGSLGLYRTGDILRPLAVEPDGAALTTWAGVKRTRVLPNFPNPFNPETWIPFELARDERVAVRIYDLRGGLVRELPLGSRSAGRHDSRATAAYWDGEDANGDPVASGVYIYEMTAGDHVTRRRMTVAK